MSSARQSRGRERSPPCSPRLRWSRCSWPRWATTASVLRLVLGQALRLVAIGVVVGVVAASLLTRLLEGMLFEVEPFDPWTFAVTAAVLLVVAIVASYVPARRGMRMAPIDALRTN